MRQNGIALDKGTRLSVDYLRGLVAAIDGLGSVRSHLQFAEQFLPPAHDSHDQEQAMLDNAKASINVTQTLLTERVLHHIRSEGEQYAREQFHNGTQPSEPR